MKFSAPLKSDSIKIMLLGSGELGKEVIIEAQRLGIETIAVDSYNNAPAQLVANRAYTINMKNKKWKDDFSPIDEMGITFVDTEYSKAYLKHLFSVNELLGKQIATIHNLGFYLWLVREARKHILAGDFNSWKNMMVKQMDKRL